MADPLNEDSKPRPARLVDIARAAGVHPSVVSRVLNKTPSLSLRPETRDRILRIAKELGYRPNTAALTLRHAASGTVGMVLPSLRNPLWSEVMRGVLSEAAGLGVAVLIAEVPDDASPNAYERLLDVARIDGLLLVSNGPFVEKISEQSLVPVVDVDRGTSGHADRVTMDERKAAGLVSDHLKSLGHTRLLHIDGPPSIETVQRRSAALHDLWSPESLTIQHAPFDESGGFTAMRDALTRMREGEDLTAVTVAGFSQLIGALAALREGKIDVPRELSVMTYDDDLILDYLDLRISSVRMPLFELGRISMLHLFNRINGNPNAAVEISDPMELVLRSSTGHARQEQLA